jgi:hypothetical protein
MQEGDAGRLLVERTSAPQVSWLFGGLSSTLGSRCDYAVSTGLFPRIDLKAVDP